MAFSNSRACLQPLEQCWHLQQSYVRKLPCSDHLTQLQRGWEYVCAIRDPSREPAIGCFVGISASILSRQEGGCNNFKSLKWQVTSVWLSRVWVENKCPLCLQDRLMPLPQIHCPWNMLTAGVDLI